MSSFQTKNQLIDSIILHLNTILFQFNPTLYQTNDGTMDNSVLALVNWKWKSSEELTVMINDAKRSVNCGQ